MKKSTMCILSGFAGSMLAVACGAVAVDKDSGVAHAEDANLFKEGDRVVCPACLKWMEASSTCAGLNCGFCRARIWPGAYSVQSWLMTMDVANAQEIAKRLDQDNIGSYHTVLLY